VRFVETNVLLYAVSRAADEHAKAEVSRDLLLRRDLALSAILEAARASGCEVVLSEDLSDGEDYDGVRVENPFRGGA
jgi:predicted nucleic acid-binding protein